MSEAQGRRSASRRILLLSLWLTLLVMAIKVWVGGATQSQSLLASALYTLLTGFSLILSILAVSAPYGAGREVWGHNRLESSLTLILAAFMGFAGFNLCALAGQQLVSMAASTSPIATVVQLSLPLLQLLALLTITQFCLGLLQRYQANFLESTALNITARQMFRDVLLMVLVLLALVGVTQGWYWADSAVAIALVVFVFVSGWQILAVQLPSILRQVAVSPEAIAQTVHQVEGITHCYNIRSRGIVGRQVWIEMRLILHPEYLEQAHSLAQQVERAIRERYGPARVVLYIENEPEPGKQKQR